jgi:hypothetical protein
MEFLPTVRADVADLSAKLDGVLGELRLGLADLNGKVVALQADVNALPR